MPKRVLKHAMSSISPPYLYTSGMLPAFIPLSIREAVTYGMSTPIITSAVVQTGVSKAATLYCFTCDSKVLNIGGYALDLHEGTFWEGLHGKCTAGRERNCEEFGINPVHCGEIAHIGNEDGSLDNIPETGSGLLQDCLEVSECLSSLSLYSALRKLSGGRIDRKLS